MANNEITLFKLYPRKPQVGDRINPVGNSNSEFSFFEGDSFCFGKTFVISFKEIHYNPEDNSFSIAMEKSCVESWWRKIAALILQW